MKRIGFGLVLLLLLTACSPEQRVARLVAKYHLPSVTEYVNDTVILPERVRTDTVVLTDPVIIEDSVLVVEIVPVNDTVFIVNTKIKSDTIIKSVPVTKYVVEDSRVKGNKEILGYVLIFFCSIVVGVALSLIIKLVF